MASKANSLLPKEHSYYNQRLSKYEQNLDMAKKLLDEAGYKTTKDGKRFSLTLSTTQDATRIAIAQAIKSDFSKIGIYLNIKILEWGKFKFDVEKGLVDLWTLTWIGFKDPDIYRYVFSTESFIPNVPENSFKLNSSKRLLSS